MRKENLEITVLTYNTHLFKGSIVEFADNLLRLFDRGRNPLVFDDNIRSRHIVSRIKECGADIVALEAKLIRKEARLRERAMELRVVGTTSEWFHLVKSVLPENSFCEKTMK